MRSAEVAYSPYVAQGRATKLKSDFSFVGRPSRFCNMNIEHQHGMAKLKIMERVFPRRRTPHEQKLRSFTSRIHQISNVHRDAMRCGSIRIRFDSRNCCPTRDSPSRLQYTASLTAELNIYNADSECQNCIDCTNWRTNLPHFSYLAARSDAMVPNRLVGIGIQCLPRMPAHGHNRFSCLARKQWS